MALLSLDQVMARADLLPALPQVVIRILNDLADERANVESLSEHIASDPAVVARLLAAANSAAVGAGQSIVSVRQAMMLLGIARVRAIVMSTAVLDRFKSVVAFDSQRLWRHSVGVAICAHQIATHAALDADAAFTAGLLHDIGQLLLFGIDPTSYGEAMQLRRREDIDVIEAERRCLGLDHAQVGGQLARLWNLPKTVADAIAGHHASDDFPPENEMADAVHVAEVLSHALDLGACPGEENPPSTRVPSLSGLACVRMGIEWREFAAYFPLIEARFDAARLTLGL